MLEKIELTILQDREEKEEKRKKKEKERDEKIEAEKEKETRKRQAWQMNQNIPGKKTARMMIICRVN